MGTATPRAGRTPGRSAAAGPSPRVWVAVGAAVLVAGLVVAWLGGWLRFGTDPRVAEILALQEQARDRFVAGGGPTNLADAAGMAATWSEIRQKMEALPPHLRPQAEQAAGRMFQSAFRARIDAYFALPPDRRQAELDRQIDQEEMMRKAFEAGRAVASALGGGQARAAEGQQPAGGQPQAGGGPAGPGGQGWASRTEEDRNRWRKSMLDRTLPQDRARYTEYRRVMEVRRLQRGLPVTGR